MMNKHELQTARLSYLMGMEDKIEPLWREDELHAVFAHQLATPIGVDLQLARDGSDTTTFGDVLFGSASELTALQAIKQFAKEQTVEGVQPMLPKSVAGVLYICSIAAVRVHLEQSITTLSDDNLRTKLEWCLGQPWIDDQTRQLLDATLTLIAAEDR